MSLDVIKICVDEETSRESQKDNEWHGCGKSEVIETNIKCTTQVEVEILEYFKLLDMRNNDRNAVTKKVNTEVSQLYLISTTAQNQKLSEANPRLLQLLEWTLSWH